MGKLFDRFVKLLRLSKKALLLKDIYWASVLATNSIPSRDAWYDRKSGKLFLKQLNVSILKGKNLFLLKGYWYAVLLVDLLQAQFQINEENKVFVQVGGMQANIETREELYILKELFVDGVYNMQFPGPVVVWDIGMHVGLASLYFARNEDVVVVGFEPFNRTFNQALRNISLNPALSDKIRAFNRGLSDMVGKVNVEYNREIDDSLGVFGVRNELTKDHQFEHEEIELADAGQALDSIVANYPGRRIVAKIDCEGSEYQILKALAKTGKLCLIEAIMMEWHILETKHDPDALASLLRDSGFNVLVLKPRNKAKGTLYAVRGNDGKWVPTDDRSTGHFDE